MASYHGNDGVVKIGANAVAEMTAFSLEIQAETADASVAGSYAKAFKPSMTSWNGSVDCLFDPDDDTGQELLIVGTAVTLIFSPQGDATTGDKVFTGSGIITGKNIASPHDGVATQSFTFQGTGALTESDTA